MRIAFTTLGCRLNRSETDAMEASVRYEGHAVVDSAEQADVVVVNGCTITHEADAEVRKLVRRLHRRNPATQIVVTGCYANAQPAEAAGLEGVTLVLGNGDKADLLRWLNRSYEAATQRPHVAVSNLVRGRSITRLGAAPSSRRARALLKVQDGCNYRCAFCIVPQVRGPSVSVPLPMLVERLRAWVEQGIPEVVLTGVHLGTYGRDLRPRRTLGELVAELLDHLGTTRLRLSSIDPHEVDGDLVNLMAAHPERLCRHLHLPVQSGDPDVLRRMRRGHTVDDFAALVARLHTAIPGISIGTDVIVGFPGEDAAAFSRTHALLEGLPLAYHHVFSYSVRRDTAAATMDRQVDPRIKAERSAILRQLSETQALNFRRQFAHSRLDAVVHIRPRRGSTRLEVLTDNYLRLPWYGSPERAGQRVAVRLDAEAQRALECEVAAQTGDRGQAAPIDGPEPAPRGARA